MKPFNLEEALAGKPIVDCHNRPARILCTDMKSLNEYKVVCLISTGDTEYLRTFNSSGETSCNTNKLFMAPVKKEGWINIYQYGEEIEVGGVVHNTKRAAVEHAAGRCIATIKIEWEE